MGLWVMTAGVEISLYMGYLHGINTGLGGPAAIGHMVFFGPVRPLDIYISYIFGVETTLVSDDCARGDIAIYHVYTCWYNCFEGSNSLW